MITKAASHPALARELRYYSTTGLPTVDEVERELRRRSLKQFTLDHWRNADPAEYVDGRHVDCICEHLEAVTRGEIRRLIINIPPRHMKSISVSVMWPAWEWMNNPAQQWLFASYAHTLSIRDSVKCRRIMESDLYKADMAALHPGFQLAGDQNTKVRFETSYGGHRISSSVGGMLTGDGGNRLCLSAGTFLLTDKGSLAVERIVDDRLVVKIMTSAGVFRDIESYQQNPASDMIEIELEDGKVLRCTPDHPIWAENRKAYVAAQDLTPDDVCEVIE
jgi:hypothetical protein